MRVLLSKIRYERQPQLRVLTNVIEDEKQGVFVRKKASGDLSWQILSKSVELYTDISKEHKSLAPILRQNKKDRYVDYEFIHGDLLEKQIENAILIRQFDQANLLFSQFITFVNRLSRPQNKKNENTTQQWLNHYNINYNVSKERIVPIVDISPDHIINSSDGFLLIDYEDFFNFDLPSRFVKFRAIFYLLHTINHLIKKVCSEEFPIKEFVHGIFIPISWDNALSFSKNEKEIFLSIEEEIQNFINWKRISLEQYKTFSSNKYSVRMENPFSVNELISLKQDVSKLEAHIKKQDKTIKEKEAEILKISHIIETIKNAKFFKLWQGINKFKRKISI